ncbi:NACHT domain-containing protein [Streptomyces sp. I05A-00742]|uniref:NACHT domain-containing protein n=1 Tax=Streptomyces sp. I05A-00742 TaxID=2732853 RepID=UPI00148968DA|nr:NACHT domain-containing protein [Streptomyces sp. I05A-00742]
MRWPGEKTGSAGGIRGRLRRAGRLFAVLTGGGIAASVHLAVRGDGLDAALPALPPTFAVAFLSWLGYRDDREEAARRELDAVANDLAGVLKGQWSTELGHRRLVRPLPPTVSWAAAPPDLAVPWDELTRAARRAPGGPAADPAGWATGPEALAGQEEELAEVFLHRIPTRRLVLLGEPGSGKTVLLIRLLLGLLARRGPGNGRVPVLFSVAGLDAATLPGADAEDRLHTWLAGQLERDHRMLADPAPTAHGDVSLARALVDGGLVIPVFDGFDELPGARRGPAMALVNEALRADQPVVLACRSAEYRDFLEESAPLAEAAAVELLPLDPGEVAEYLRATALGNGPRSAAAVAAVEERWGAVLERLGGSDPVARTLATPLGVFLARAVHGPDGEGGSPAELLALTTREEVERHLFGAFIRTAYRPNHRRPCRWTAAEAHRAFVVLARHLRDTLDGSTQIAWWELHRALPARSVQLLVAGLGAVAVGAVPWYVAGPGAGVGAALIVGAVAALATGRQPRPASRIRWSWRGVTLVPGAVAGLVTGFAVGPAAGLAPALASVLVCGSVVGFLTGLSPEPLDVTAADPAGSLARDRRTALRTMLLWTLAAGSVAGLVADRVAGPVAAFVAAPVVGTVMGLAIGFGQTAWGLFTAARGFLRVRKGLPRDLMAFLADAHGERGVLRRTGAVYQFRHLSLQRHLEGQELD